MRFRDMRWALVWIAFGVVTAFAGDEASEPLTGDLAKLQGTWTTKAGSRGKLNVELTIEGTRVQALVKPPIGKPLRLEGTLRIDDRTSPKSLSWLGFSGPDGEEVSEVPAIYKFENDKWVVCNAGPNDARPTEFASGDGVLAQVVTFQRKPAKSAPAGTTVAAAPAQLQPKSATR